MLVAAKHLVKRQYIEPHYNVHSGQVMAYEKVTLYGLVIIEKKAVSYSHVDPLVCREVFIRAAFVEGLYSQQPQRKNPHIKKSASDFFSHQEALLKELEDLEAKARRRDIVADEKVIFDFYNERIPESIVNLAGFESWRKKIELTNPTLLFISRENLMRHGAEDITQLQFPSELEWRGMVFPLSYHFEPNHADDGVSIHVPVSVLHQVPEHRLEWLVPGMLRDKCIGLVKGLPKNLRKHFVPVPDVVDKVLAAMTPDNKPLSEALALQLKRQTAIDIGKDIWTGITVDDFYRFNIKVMDEQGKVIDSGRDLLLLREKYRERVQKNIQSAAVDIEKQDITEWDFGDLPVSIQLQRSGMNIRAYPALVDKNSSVALQVLDNPLQAQAITQRGLARLLFLQLSQTVKYLQKELLKGQDIALTLAGIGTRAQVVDDLIMATIKNIALPNQTQLPRSLAEFELCLNLVREKLMAQSLEVASHLLSALTLLVDVKKQIKQQKNALALAFTLSDIQDQLQQLFFVGVVYQTPELWLRQYPRYLKAIQYRLEKAALNPQKDKLSLAEIQPYWKKLADYLEKEGEFVMAQSEPLAEYRWWIEELRVSLFAQTIKTLVPISPKRLVKQWELVLAK